MHSTMTSILIRHGNVVIRHYRIWKATLNKSLKPNKLLFWYRSESYWDKNQIFKFRHCLHLLNQYDTKKRKNHSCKKWRASFIIMQMTQWLLSDFVVKVDVILRVIKMCISNNVCYLGPWEQWCSKKANIVQSKANVM